MSNVNHRYSSESWTLDLSGKRSPLSRWTGRDLLRDETFRLSLLGAQGGIAPVVWLSGDRPCFEELHRTLEAYVQQGLSEPVLGDKSTFPAGAPANAQLPASPTAGQFSLKSQGLLRHSLNYTPKDNSSSPRQMQLSMLQLADLLAVLDQWQTETLALPERQPKLSILPGGKDHDFVVPTWGRIAASVVVAIGATGIGGYILSQNLSGSAPQVALESAPTEAEANPPRPAFGESPNGSTFGQFPTAGGPPITSQAQQGDTAFNNPLLPPQDAQTSPPTGIIFPTSPLPRDSNLGPMPVPPIGSVPSGGAASGLPQPSEEITIASGGGATGNSDSLSPSPTGPAAKLGNSNAAPTAPPTAPPFAEPTLADGPLLDSTPEEDRAMARANDEASLAAEPPPPQASSPAINPPQVESAQIATAPVPKPGTTSRGGRPIAESEPALAAPTAAPTAPPTPQVSVAKPLPANNQSRAVQTYLQSQWKPPSAIQQPLQYRLRISPEGKLTSVEALSPTAQLYVNDAKLPPVGGAISGAADTVQSTLVVTLTPAGQVDVAIEKTTPAVP